MELGTRAAALDHRRTEPPHALHLRPVQKQQCLLDGGTAECEQIAHVVELAAPLPSRPPTSVVGTFERNGGDAVLQERQAQGEAPLKAVVASACEVHHAVEGGAVGKVRGKLREEHAGTGDAALWWKAVVDSTRAWRAEGIGV